MMLLWLEALGSCLKQKMKKMQSVRASFEGFFICLFWTIASFAHISGQFSADAGFMYFKLFGYFGRTVSYFLQRRYLVSLFRGKLFVGSHRAPLTWPSKE